MDLDPWKDLFETIAYVAASLGVIVSVCQYRRNSRRDRTRWLFELHERFHEQRWLSDVRDQIDWGKTGFIAQGTDKKSLRHLDDYLNFFELIGHLLERGELEEQEIRVLFEYPLRKIAENRDVVGWVKQYGYEELSGLLDRLGYTPT